MGDGPMTPADDIQTLVQQAFHEAEMCWPNADGCNDPANHEGDARAFLATPSGKAILDIVAMVDIYRDELQRERARTLEVETRLARAEAAVPEDPWNRADCYEFWGNQRVP
jgi:hypothetical protein